MRLTKKELIFIYDCFEGQFYSLSDTINQIDDEIKNNELANKVDLILELKDLKQKYQTLTKLNNKIKNEIFKKGGFD